MDKDNDGHEIWPMPRVTATTVGELRSALERFDSDCEVTFWTPDGRPLEFSMAGGLSLCDMNGEQLCTCKIELH